MNSQPHEAISDIRGPQMSSLFELQPECCRAPLPTKIIRSRSRHAAVIQRIVALDPAPLYVRIAATANPCKRIQTRADMNLRQLFPQKSDGCCDCGCGVVLFGRKTRWASADCSDFVWHVYAIIAGRRTEIKRCLKTYYGRRCADCGKVPSRVSAHGKMRSGIEFDHIVPVHRSGGACWLSNYRMLCVDCHRTKTAVDRLLRKGRTVETERSSVRI